MKNKYKKHHVYKFLDSENRILYIGRSSNLKVRLETHDNLSKECYRAIDRIEVIEFDDEYEMCNAEGYFIDFYKPKYNSKQEKFCKSFPHDLWKEYKMKVKIGSVKGRFKTIEKCNTNIVENIVLKNVPVVIRNLLFYYKTNMNIKSLKKVIKELNEIIYFDKEAVISVSCDTKIRSTSSEFNQDLSFGFVNGKLKFTCNKDSLIYDDLEDFYYIDLIDMNNVLITLMNFYYNNEKFKFIDNKIYNLNEDYIPLLRNGVLVTSRDQFIEMCDEELEYRLDIVEKEKLIKPKYLSK